MGRGRGLVAAGMSLAAGSLALPLATGAPAAALSSGCLAPTCSGDAASWGSCSQGERVDANTWESGPLDGTYLDFSGERTWTLDPSPWMGQRTPVGFTAFIAFDAEPYASGGSGFAQAAGNLAEFLPAGDAWKVSVKNDSCAQYYLRVVLTYAADDGGAPATSTCGS